MALSKIYLGKISEIYEKFKDSFLDDAALIESAASFSPNRKRTYLAGRALLKRALNIKGALPPITLSRLGKPYFADKSLPFFNLSHSKDIIGLAIGPSEMGFDLELCKSRALSPDLVERVLSKKEIELFATLPEDEQKRFFVKEWTIRESIVKACAKSIFSALYQCEIDPITHRAHVKANITGTIITSSLQQIAGDILTHQGIAMQNSAKIVPSNGKKINYDVTEVNGFFSLFVPNIDSTLLPPMHETGLSVDIYLVSDNCSQQEFIPVPLSSCEICSLSPKDYLEK